MLGLGLVLVLGLGLGLVLGLVPVMIGPSTNHKGERSMTTGLRYWVRVRVRVSEGLDA